MTYLRKKKQQNLTTSFTANAPLQDVSDSVVDIEKSSSSALEVSFTPPSGNFEFVVYEFTIQYYHGTNDDTNTGLNLELRQKIGNNAYTQLGDGYRMRETAERQRFQSTITGRFLIPIYTGTRTYKMTIRASSTNREATLHRTRGGYIYSPIIQMYCI
tara:strand:+ start:1084 stop:1557 length:474 start_codon:yes stop_codon:yes gene_type:complete